MNPDQTAPEPSDLGPYYLQFRLTKMRMQTTTVVNDGKRAFRGVLNHFASQHKDLNGYHQAKMSMSMVLCHKV